MAQIKIFQPKTYTSEIKKIRADIMDFSENTKREIIEEQYLSDYTSSQMWDVYSDFGKIHNKLMNCLEKHDIIAYHNTRLRTPKKIVNDGLIFSDERYIKSIREDMLCQEISEDLIEDVVMKVIKERDRWECNGINRRKNEICFIFDFDYYKDYDKFLATYGGEFLEFALTSIKDGSNLVGYREIIKLGKPYVVEFFIPYSKMDKFQKQDIARYILEEWIHLDLRKDEVSHQYDGRIEFEIPADNIIKIYDVEDYFPDIDRWLFNEY